MYATRLIRETVTLKDDRRVVLRPIRPEDAPRLMELHDRLSTDSQYYRFFGPKPELTRPEAEYLANVDFNRRFAIVATVTPDSDEEIVAVGRFDIVGPDTAEPAIVVRDDYQGSGLGPAILERMVEVARGRGVERFVAEILAENSKMIDILRNNGLQISRSGDGIVQVTAPITDRALPLRALQLLARGVEEVAEKRPSLRRPQSRKPQNSRDDED